VWPDDRDTRELLDAAKRGEESAANLLFDRHRRAMRRVVAMRMDRRLARRIDASDIVQEALLVASRRLPAYLDGSEIPFHLWLRRIALDRLLDAHRRHRVADKRNMDRERPLYSDRSSRELAGQLADLQPTPGALAIRAELTRRFEAAIEELPDPDREILLMRHYEHLTNREAATVLNLSDAAAAMRYLRALRRLRDSVGGESE
jgi:RNA polymerase sigma-70 factor (ECF subfamily)